MRAQTRTHAHKFTFFVPFLLLTHTHKQIRGESLHGPLIERLLELPMDIHEGRVDGQFRIRAYDTPSWAFPELYGRMQCRGEREGDGGGGGEDGFTAIKKKAEL